MSDENPYFLHIVLYFCTLLTSFQLLRHHFACSLSLFVCVELPYEGDNTRVWTGLLFLSGMATSLPPPQVLAYAANWAAKPIGQHILNLLFSTSHLSNPLAGNSQRNTHLLTHKCKGWGFLEQCKSHKLGMI